MVVTVMVMVTVVVVVTVVVAKVQRQGACTTHLLLKFTP